MTFDIWFTEYRRLMAGQPMLAARDMQAAWNAGSQAQRDVPRQLGEMGAGVDELSDEHIQKLWDEACKDGPGWPGWSRHIRFAKAVSHHAIAAFLDRTGQYVTNDASREAAIDAAMSREQSQRD